jgi:hypothetical protein
MVEPMELQYSPAGSDGRVVALSSAWRLVRATMRAKEARQRFMMPRR